MVVVPAGNFMMGSYEVPVLPIEEVPVHKVTIAKQFAVGKFEVTFAEWDACVAGRSKRPVISRCGPCQLSPAR
jgi:formylglycine-generating enzyme required for sulfatase activity